MSVTADLSLNLVADLIGAAIVAFIVYLLITRREKKHSDNIISNHIIPTVSMIRGNMLTPIVNAVVRDDLAENFPGIAKVVDKNYIQIIYYGEEKLKKLLGDPDLKILIANDARNLINPIHIQVLETEFQDFRLAAGRYIDHLPPGAMSALESFLKSVRHLLFIYHLVLNSPNLKHENIGDLVVNAWGRVVSDSFFFEKVASDE